MEVSPMTNMQTSQPRKRKHKRKKNSQNSSSQSQSNPSVNTVAVVTNVKPPPISLRGAALMESQVVCATGRVKDLRESDTLKKSRKGSPVITSLGGSLENTRNASSLKKNKSTKKKKKENKVSDVPLDSSIMKIDATIKVSRNESLAPVTTSLEGSLENTRKEQKKKSTKKKKKEDKVPDFPLDNSIMNTDATIKNSCKSSAPVITSLVGSLENTRRVSSLQKKRSTKKKKKEDNVPDFPLDNSIVKIDATIKDSCNESLAMTNLESPKMNGDASWTKKKKRKKRQKIGLNIEKKRKKRQKTIHNNIGDNVNGSGLPQDTFSSENSVLALDKPLQHSVQCLSMDPVMRASCAEKTFCQDVSSIPSSVVADKKESLLEVVKLNTVQGINDSSPKPEDKNASAKNENLMERQDGYPVLNHVSHKGKKLKTYSRRTRVNTNHLTVGSGDKLETEVSRDQVTSNREAATEEMKLITENTCEHRPVTDVCVVGISELQREEKNGRKVDSKQDAGHDMSSPGDVADLSLVGKKDDHSKISFSSLNRTVTSQLKKKLIILDVNGLLADFANYCPRGYRPDLRLHKKSVFKRPYVNDFLRFCFAKFHVGIWSSRTKKNLDLAVKFLMKKSASKLLFCWNQSHCTRTKFYTLENEKKPLVLKDIRKLWKKFNSWEKGEFNESNTLLLDDSPYKAILNPMNTAIFPRSYSFRNRRDKSLGPGGGIRVYLEGLARAENVQEYVASNPFGQRAITESSRTWGYYKKVIDSFK